MNEAYGERQNLLAKWWQKCLNEGLIAPQDRFLKLKLVLQLLKDIDVIEGTIKDKKK